MRTKVIIGTVAVLVLAALGGGGWYYLKIAKSKPQNPNVPTTGEQQVVTPIVDVDDILNQKLENVERKIGQPNKIDDTAVRWSISDISIIAIRFSPERPFETISIDFTKSQSRANFSLLLIGVDIESPPTFSVSRGDLWRVERDYGWITVSKEENTGAITNVVIYNYDSAQKGSLGFLKTVLNAYFSKKSQYPTTENKLVLFDAENLEQTIIFKELSPVLETLTPLFPYLDWKILTPRFNARHGYRSDGKTYYELTAVLDDTSDPECVVEGNFCIYRIRNGEVVSKK